MELGVPGLERTLRLVISPQRHGYSKFRLELNVSRHLHFSIVISAIHNGFLLVGMILGTITRLTLNLKLGEGF